LPFFAPYFKSDNTSRGVTALQDFRGQPSLRSSLQLSKGSDSPRCPVGSRVTVSATRLCGP
jgi:hypothetical protein